MSVIWHKLPQIERANRLSKKKFFALRKAVKDKKCDLGGCQEPFPAGEMVGMTSNREHLAHKSCIRRVQTQHAASKASRNILDIVLPKESAVESVAKQTGGMVSAKRPRPDKLILDIETIHIEITFKD